MRSLISLLWICSAIGSSAFAQTTRSFEYDTYGQLVHVTPIGGVSVCYAYDNASNRSSVVAGCAGTGSVSADPAFAVNGQWPLDPNSAWGPNWGSQVPFGDAGTGVVARRWQETQGASQIKVQVMTGPSSTGQSLKVLKSQDGTALYNSTISSNAAWTTLTISVVGTSHVDIVLTDAGAGWGQWSAMSPVRIASLPGSIPGMPTTTPTYIDPAWSSGGAWPDASPWGMRWSSYATFGDAGVGKVIWGNASVGPGRRVELLAQTGPSTGQQRIIVRNANTSAVIVDIAVTDVTHVWQLLAFDLPQGVSAIDIEVQDNGSGWGEWIAVTAPRLL